MKKTTEVKEILEIIDSEIFNLESALSIFNKKGKLHDSFVSSLETLQYIRMSIINKIYQELKENILVEQNNSVTL